MVVVVDVPTSVARNPIQLARLGFPDMVDEGDHFVRQAFEAIENIGGFKQALPGSASATSEAATTLASAAGCPGRQPRA